MSAKPWLSSFLIVGALSGSFGIHSEAEAVETAQTDGSDASQPVERTDPAPSALEQARQLKADHPELFGAANGVLVTGIVPGGQGEGVGLRPGDILLEYGGITLKTASHLIRLTGEAGDQDPVELLYLRQGVRQRIQLSGGRIGVVISSLAPDPAVAKTEEVQKLAEAGNIALQSGRYPQALEHFEQALAINRELGDRAGEATSLINLGLVYGSRGQYPQALKYYRQSLAIYRELGDRSGEATSLNNVGAVYGSRGQYPQALEHFEQSLTIKRELGDRANEAASLNNLGNVYSKLGQYSQALEYYRQSLAINRELGDRAGEADNLNNLGTVYESLGRYTKALEHHEQSLAIKRDIGNRAGEASSLNNLGIVYKRLGQYPQALDHYEQSLAIDRDLGDRSGESDSLGGLGTVHKSLGQYTRALEFYRQSLAIERELGRRAGEAASLNNLGSVYDSLGQYPQAFEHFEQSLTIQRDIGGRAGEAVSLNNLGNMCESLGQYPQALEYHRQSLAIKRDIGDRAGVAGSLNNLGMVYDSLGQYPQALDYYEQALAIQRELGHRAGEVSSLNGLGMVYESLGQYPQALEHFEQSLAIIRDIGDRAGEATSLNNLGIVYYDLGQYSQALEHYRLSLEIRRDIGARAGESASLNNLGNVYDSLGQYPQALDYHEQSLAIERELGQRAGEAASLNNLGMVYDSLGQYPRALEYHRQSLAIVRELGQRAGEAASLNNLGSVYYELGQNPQALEYYRQSLAINRDIGDRAGEAGSLHNLGNVYRSLGQYPQALTTYREALSIATPVGEPETLWRIWHGMSKTLHHLEQPLAAVLAGKQAVNTLQAIRTRNQALDRTQRTGFFENKTFVYRALADRLSDQGRLPEAEQVLDMLKEEEQIEYLRGNRAAAQRLTTRADCNRWEEPHCQQLQTLSRDLREAGEALAAAEKRAEQARLAELDQVLQARRAALLEGLGQINEALAEFQGDPYYYLAIQEQVRRQKYKYRRILRELGHGAVALHYLLLEDSVRIILTTPDTQLTRETPIKLSKLRRKVISLRQAILRKQASSDLLALSQELYALLIAPVADELNAARAETLMVSLDGILRYVPFAALHDSERYLIERYAISIQTLAADTDLKDTPRAHWRVAGFGVSRAAEIVEPGGLEAIPFDALAMVPDELDAIIRQGQDDGAGVLPGDIYLDEAFTRQQFVQVLSRGDQDPVLHIASHFNMRPGNSSRSFLLLGNNQSLNMAEVYDGNLDFSGADLVSLSACDTAMGDGRSTYSEGAEIESFGALVQDLGAKSVLATLWKVADESTGVLMQQFYALREEQALTKAEALRQAQLAMLTGDEGYGLPYYWAPFILMGNWL